MGTKERLLGFFEQNKGDIFQVKRLRKNFLFREFQYGKR